MRATTTLGNLIERVEAKGGEVVEFKHWPQKIALPGLQE
jgi:hypothetical protein